MKRNFKVARLIEDVRDLSSIASTDVMGRLDISKAIELVADRYSISKNPDDYCYLVVVALCADKPNDNGDAFPLAELERFEPRYGCKVYQTFVLKPHFIEHKQDGDVYGFVLDAHLEKPKDDNAYVELVLAVDTKKDPVYGGLVKAGKVNAFSMGCSVDYTVCNVCGHKAYVEAEFCEHIKSGKMKTFKVAGSNEEKLAFEWLYGICFDEISAVSDPAEEKALLEEKLASKVENIKVRLGVLKQKYREDTGRKEWCLVSKDGDKVLKWFGPEKPSEEEVAKEERRVQYFKHKGGKRVLSQSSQDKEKGWLINLSKDISEGKVSDETKAQEWFRERYKREPDPGEMENMRSLFSRKRIRQRWYKLLKKGNNLVEIGCREIEDDTDSIITGCRDIEDKADDIVIGVKNLVE